MAQGRAYDPFKDSQEELEQARIGRITPEEAERLAHEKGLGPLARSFKSFQLDDPKLAVWTFEMTAAWISWRDPARVLRHFGPAYSTARQWVQNTVIFPRQTNPFVKPADGRFGHDLHVFGPTNIREYFHEFDGKRASFDFEKSWWDKLYKELVAGRIHASGEICAEEWAEEKGLSADRSEFEKDRLKMMVANATETGDRRGGIPRAFWRHLTIGVSGGETVLRYQDAPLYRALKFDAEEVRNRFPADVENADQFGRAQLLWRYREPQTVNGDMSIAVAAMIRATHFDGFPRTKPMFSEVLEIITRHDAENKWGFEDRSDDASRKFVNRLMEKLLDDEYCAQP